MTILLWLVEFIGLKGLKSLSVGLVKWTVRLLLLGVLLILIVTVVKSPQLRGYALLLAVLAVAAACFRWWWRNRHGKTYAAERTIDGKTVPDKLAAAALGIPPTSPDADYVLRGLPDYGKKLLKVSFADFEYLPEMPEPTRELPLEEPNVRNASPLHWYWRWRGWAFAVIAALLVGGIWTWLNATLDADIVVPDGKVYALIWVLVVTCVCLVVILGWKLFRLFRRARTQAAERELPLEEPDVKTPSYSPWVMERTIAALIFAALVGTEVYEHFLKRWQLSTDGTTWTDTQTGLAWQATGYKRKFNWSEAKAYCEMLPVRQPHFRLPTRQELAVVGADSADPAAKFVLGFGLLWTAETVAEDPKLAYIFVEDRHGIIARNIPDTLAKENPFPAVCVRP